MIYIRENYSKRLKIISILAADTFDLLRRCVCVCVCFVFFLCLARPAFFL